MRHWLMGFRRQERGLAPIIAVSIVLATIAAACSPTSTPSPPAPAAQPSKDKSAAPKAELPAAAKPASMPPIRVLSGPPAQYPNHLSVLVALNEGFFKEAGFDSVDWKFAGNDGNALAGLISGNGEFSVATSTEAVAKLAAKGEKLFIIGSTSNNLPLSLFSTKAITRISDLKGKKIATATDAGTVDGYIEKILARDGLSPSDATLVRLGNDSERYAGLANGIVDAAPIGPLLKARTAQEGYPELVDMAVLFNEYLQRTYVTSGDFFQKHPQAVDAFMLAIVRAHDFLHQPANANRVWEILESRQYQIEQKFFEGTLKAQLDLMPRNALPSAAGLQVVLDEVRDDAPGVTPDSLLRLDPVRKAIQQTGVQPG